MKKILISLFFISAIFAKETKLIKAAGSPRVKTGEKEFIIEGLTLVPGGSEIKEISRKPGIQIIFSEDEALEEDPMLVEKLKPYLKQSLTETLLSEIKKTIVDFFREDQGLYVAVIVPVQKIQNHVVVLQILEGSIGRVQYKGQKWFSETIMRNTLAVKPGDPLNETEFLNDVTWANRNPFRSTKMVLVPGKQKGITNLVFLTKDRFPVRCYVGADNTGFQSNSIYRIYGGFNWGNAFRMGDLLSYQYTASPDFHKFQSHVANYTSFLPWQHILSVYGTYGIVYPVVPGFTVTGKNLQGSFRYQIPIRPLFGLYRHSFEFGADYKYLTSSLFYAGDVDSVFLSPSQTIAITEFLTSYKFEKNSENFNKNLTTFRLDMYVSPWKSWVIPHQTSGEYERSRPFSHVRYAYWRGAISNIYKMDRGITLKTQLRGQLATGTLPVAEQFGLGGMNTVRGYYEQQFVADDAVVINLEAFTPEIKVLKKVKNTLSFLFFVDYGFGYNYSFLAPEFKKQNLLGAGPGIRFDINQYFKGRLDYGAQVIGISQDKQIGRFHFSMVASY